MKPRQLMDLIQVSNILWSATTVKRMARIFMDGDWYILELNDWFSDKEMPELVPMSKTPENAMLLMDMGTLWLMEKRLFEVQADSRKDGVDWEKQDKGIIQRKLRYRLRTDDLGAQRNDEFYSSTAMALLYDRQEKARTDRLVQLKRGSRRKEMR